ncbi:PREDICTED: CUB and sushi domain-containing protein 1-like [Branchiostoma belcheri]|uniref:CUB and sushi domain-containing protein 1-like n=1 Tax=Branchiostoma belcheri TaxID=7741 RepID=A0A6P5AIZ5_BRABE|nr:PREDICTED: CUB and sushi domain-containing protein 1-like [Branchiostoma belcheri]
MERRYGVDFRPRVSPELVGPTKSAWPTYCDHLYTRGRPKGKRTKRKVRPSEAPTQTKCSTGEPRTAALSSSYSSLRGVSPFENSSSSVSGVEFDLESERSFYLPFEDDADGESGFGSLPGTPEVPESERTSCCDDDQISFTTQDTSISDYCASETSEGKESEDTSFFKTQQEKPAADVFPPCVETRDHRSEEKLEKPHREKPETDVFTATAEIKAGIRDKRDYKGPWRHYGPPGIPEILRRKEKKKKDEDDLRRLKRLLLIFSSLSVLALAVVVAIVMGHFLQPEELPDWLALFSFPGKEDPLIRDDLRAIVAARTPPDIPPVISDCFNVSLPLADHGSYTCSDVTYGPRFGQLYIVTFCVLRCDVGYHGEDAGLLFCDNSGDNSTWSPVAPEVVSSLVGLGQAAGVVTRSESLTANLTQLGVNGTIYTRETAGVMSRLDLADEISLGSLEENLALFEFHTEGIIGDPYVLRQALSHTSPGLIAEVSRLNFTAALAELDAFGASKNPECKKLDCGEPKEPGNGSLHGGNTQFWDEFTVHCDPGYERRHARIRCLGNGNWSLEPMCDPVECGDPPSFPNTEFECSTGTSFPGSCTASCGTGYRNTNYTHVTCGSHGNWTLGNDTEILLERLADDFFCERKDCGVLQEPTHGSLACTGTRFEDTCKLTCDTGYEVTEDDGISLFDEEGYTCTESGTWSSQPTCGESDFCLHGHDDCDLQYGVCEHTGHRNFSCRCAQGTLGDGRSCALPVCGILNATEPDHGKLFCESQSSLGMGSADCRDPSPSGVDNQEYASVCRLICNPGYKQTLDVSYMCLKNGTWHAPLDLENENIQPCVDIDECLSTPCKNNATCSNLENAYSCACVPGFTGTDCDEEINECDSDPCRNGGSCSDGVDDYTCSCLPGWTGEICETDIDECSSSPCQHGGTCEDHVNGYTCHCAEGWEGEDCEISELKTSLNDF